MICADADASSGRLVEYVVDVHFKELFRIAYCSHTYRWARVARLQRRRRRGSGWCSSAQQQPGAAGAADGAAC